MQPKPLRLFYNNPSCCVDPCHHGTVCLCVPDVERGPLIWRVAANVLNKLP